MERDDGKRPPTQREPSGELLGPYTLLTELARGELTTVHLAKKQGALGFQRLVTVKRLRSEYASQESCAKLLVDEARLTAGLHHANLVGVLDVGSEGGCYVVSDYIEGENLERVMVREGASAQPRFVIPLLVDTLNGLHAVHHAFGEDDAPLHIVHQAPCARHILVGVDGVGRLTDFSQMNARGIAPSRTRSERLRVAYMAPEQALDPEHVDHRADLFIVGITLWEALTGERLFAAETEERTFQNLLHRRIPRPSEVGACPPRSLDAVCMRALERNPEARFASALEMARELRDAALNEALFAAPGEIGAWVQRVMGKELVERRRKAGEVSVELPLPGARSSGFVDPRGQEDPYLNGHIYGGSPMSGHSSDPDKTPVHVRRERGLFPIQRGDEPTGARYLAFHSLNDVPRPPRRARVNTPPYGAFSDGQSAPAESHGGSVVEEPALAAALDATPVHAHEPSRGEAALDTARTTPNRVAPSSRPIGGTPPPRPGAYSQVDPALRQRASRAPNASSTSRPPAREVGPATFDELDTGRYTGVTSLPPPAEASARESAPPRASRAPRSAQRTSLPPPLPRKSGPVIEAETLAVTRQDSSPTRLSIPAEPVGVPMGSRSRTNAEILPKTFEAIRASEANEGLHAGNSPLPSVHPAFEPSRAVGGGAGHDRPAMDAVSSVRVLAAQTSLTPPNTAERTLPPRADDDAGRSQRSARWWAFAAAAAILVAFIGANLSQSAERAKRNAASAAESSTVPRDQGSLDQGLPSAAAQEPADLAEPAAHREPEAPSALQEAAVPVSPARLEADDTMSGAAKLVGAAKLKDRRVKANSGEAPVTNAARVEKKPRAAARSAIPDNPY